MNRIIKKSAIYLFFVFVLALNHEVLAQKARRQTVVLNDGNWITGTIVSDTGNFLKIRITTPQEVSILKSEVFILEPSLSATNRLASRQSFNQINIKGYNIRVSASVLSGKNEQGSTGTMSFNFSNGFRFRNGLEAGIGAGIEEFEAVIMPVYADMRFHPLKTRVSPFVWIRSGVGIPMKNKGNEENYSFGNYSDIRPGAMFNLGAGMALYSGRKFGVNVGLGYRYQKLTFREKNLWRQEMYNEIIKQFNRIEVQFGFSVH
jgi:sRNA-binding carbon storage regulator CsrA